MTSPALKLVVLGGTNFTEALLAELINHKFDVRLVVGIAKEFSISYSDNPVTNCLYSDLRPLCQKSGIIFNEIGKDKNDKLSQYYSAIAQIKPDVILALGWYYKLTIEFRDLAKYGAWGIHASLLPDYAGGAPLTWAMIEGQKVSGVTLFRMAEETDGGDIIAQEKFAIDENETIKEVQAKAIVASKKILIESLSNIDKIEYRPQNQSLIKIYPQRTPKDGLIDLTKPAREVYNFIRAQSSPYSGAFLRAGDGKKVIIEKARLED